MIHGIIATQIFENAKKRTAMALRLAVAEVIGMLILAKIKRSFAVPHF